MSCGWSEGSIVKVSDMVPPANLITVLATGFGAVYVLCKHSQVRVSSSCLSRDSVCCGCRNALASYAASRLLRLFLL